jgi:hypothetical protein
MEPNELQPPARPTRELTPVETAAIEEMYRRKAKRMPTDGYATTAAPLEMSKWNGHHHPSVEANMTYTPIPVGTTLKIVMASRLGDCGLTDDLAADYGYGLRMIWEDAALSNIRLAP